MKVDQQYQNDQVPILSKFSPEIKKLSEYGEI